MAEDLADAVLELQPHQGVGDLAADRAAFAAQDAARFGQPVGGGAEACQHLLDGVAGLFERLGFARGGAAGGFHGGADGAADGLDGGADAMDD